MIRNGNAMVSEKRAALERLCHDTGVVILYAFGSRARDVLESLDSPSHALPPSTSDVDIGALAAPGVVWDVTNKVHLAIALEDLLDCPRVDLVVLNEADPFVAAEIIRGERLFANNAHAADEYDLYVLRRAGDLAPLEHERLDLIFKVNQ